MRPFRIIAGLAGLAAAWVSIAATPSPEAPLDDLAGTWAGTLVHGADSTPVALTFVPGDSLDCSLMVSIPAIHLDRTPFGRFVPVFREDSVRVGPFAFHLDRIRGRLAGVMPASLVPVYRVPVRLERAQEFEMPARTPPVDMSRTPRWTFDAGSAVWAGPSAAGGRIYAGTVAGDVFALDAASGAERWRSRLGGAVRVRPVVDAGRVYVQADDGVLYALDEREGRVRWSTRLVPEPIVRLPFSDARSRYDRFGSDVVSAEGRLYVGTHDGRMVALDPEDGAILWSFQSGDAVLAAPAVADGRVIFGSFDRHVYALDALRGTLLWTHDAAGAVVSTPALHGGVAVVGTRSYDLLGLDVATGAERWKRYIWMSWVESSARIADGVAYVGSSDAAAVFAFDAASGALRWKRDVHGWAWGQPAVHAGRVYAGTSSQAGYPAGHRAGLVALDATRGTPLWRFAATAADTGAFGFAGSVATDADAVYAATLAGRIHAFDF